MNRAIYGRLRQVKTQTVDLYETEAEGLPDLDGAYAMQKGINDREHGAIIRTAYSFPIGTRVAMKGIGNGQWRVWPCSFAAMLVDRHIHRYGQSLGWTVPGHVMRQLVESDAQAQVHAGQLGMEV